MSRRADCRLATAIVQAHANARPGELSKHRERMRRKLAVWMRERDGGLLAMRSLLLLVHESRPQRFSSKIELEKKNNNNNNNNNDWESIEYNTFVSSLHIYCILSLPISSSTYQDSWFLHSVKSTRASIYVTSPLIRVTIIRLILLSVKTTNRDFFFLQ